MKGQSLYFNGEVLTMDDPIYAEAVLVEDGVITHVGKRDDLLALINAETHIVNLNGATLMPGFIDCHGHFTAMARTMGSAPLDQCRSFADIIDALRAFRSQIGAEPGDWITATGYDPAKLREQRHLDRALLDAALPGCRTVISHVSGEFGVASSAALEHMNITPDTYDPVDGAIMRVDGIPNGLLAGGPFDRMLECVEPANDELLISQMERAQAVYAQYGITTMQDGMVRDIGWKSLRKFSDSGLMKLDLISYIDPKKAKHLARENMSRVMRYKRHLKLGGYALHLDGEPQTRSAWMSAPYLGPDQDECGNKVYSDEESQFRIFETLNEHMQLLAHCSGDAACEQLLTACDRITEGVDIGLRPIVSHCQFVRVDQLERMSRLGIIPSFAAPHLYFWADTHLKNLGPKRAEKSCPAQTAGMFGLSYTLHQDAPHMTSNPLISAWCAVNRLSRGGLLVGEEEQISTVDALRAITVNAAYQYFEEEHKGTITPGKLADFVILDHSPLRVRPADLRRLRVLKTIKEDEVVYERGE